MIESIPNVSEGRRPSVITDFTNVIRRIPRVLLLDVHSDSSHNRSVLTLAGDAAVVREAILALVDSAIRHIDMRAHRGVHPRIGAVDVVPFVPLDGATMEQCVALAVETGAELARVFALPVYLYEAAARYPGRGRLEQIRRGQFEGLASRMLQPEWRPDFGPSSPHPTAGALAVGARMPLVAYNVNLVTDRVEIAKRIAASVRESSGGLRCVKALGVMLEDRRIAQVTMNLTDYRVTSVRDVYDAVTAEAAKAGVEVLESELVGLVPLAALTAVDAEHVRLRQFSKRQVLEDRLREVAAAHPNSSR